LHSYRDASITFKEGKILADLIPNSKFVRLDSYNHILQDNEPAWVTFWDEIYRFIDITEDYHDHINISATKIKRILKTIVFTDIVESTRLALELGDKHWIELLETHHEIAQRMVGAYEGEIIKDTGDGYLILFESPSNAFAYTKELIKELNTISVNIRCGIHAGEVERISGDVRGINIHIASRILGEACTNEILVSEVVKEIGYGSSFKFKSKGRYQLKGIPDSKELFQVL
jgi:class 3 adenylate cyclase